MKISVLRIGQRIVRDDRVTTHAALVARAFGASRIYMSDINPDIIDTVNDVCKMWGGNFIVDGVSSWRNILYDAKKRGEKIVHLTMYGTKISDVIDDIATNDAILIVIGAQKVPRDVYDMADFNVAIGSQPHSEIAALAVTLDRLQNGCQFDVEFTDGRHKIVPTGHGKRVI